MHIAMLALIAVVSGADGGSTRKDAGVAVLDAASDPKVPLPLLAKGQPVDWWFAFKFNAETFPACSKAVSCPFGGTPKGYKAGEQFVYASSKQPQLKMITECIGESTDDPVGATFDEVYNGSFNYLIWNDQFYDDPKIAGCKKECESPWGHSKGLLSWNDQGEGFVMQVSTPSWPAAGSKDHARKDGNTLGCVGDDDVEVSQHFFALKLTKEDLLVVLSALSNASVVTDVKNQQIAKLGGPADVVKAANALGKKSTSRSAMREELSTSVLLISKPSNLNVPPWQLVSSLLKGASLRTATWWTKPAIPSTTKQTPVKCWGDNLGKPGAVEIATSGAWQGKKLGFLGEAAPIGNHSKLGVTTTGTAHEVIFGDENQQGTLVPDAKGKCDSSQNGRGGLFYVLSNEPLFNEVTALLKGDSAPVSK